jgi:hypothetical protein
MNKEEEVVDVKPSPLTSLTDEQTGSLRNLCGFLEDPQEDLRAMAIRHLMSVAATEWGKEFFRQSPTMLERVFRLVFSMDFLIAHDALSTLINLTVDPICREQFLFTGTSRSTELQGLIRLTIDKQWPWADLSAMLLSNLTQEESVARQLMKMADHDGGLVDESSSTDFNITWLDDCLEAFLGGRNYNSSADYHFLASVFANLSRYPSIRVYLVSSLNSSSSPLRKLLSSLQHPNVIRRGGIASLVKNCCLDVGLHDHLLQEDLELLTYLLLPLIGNEEYSDEDMMGMPSALQFQPSTKERESDVAVRHLLVECLMLLMVKRRGRELLRERKVYPIMRELEKTESDATIKELIYSIVDLLLRKETEP